MNELAILILVVAVFAWIVYKKPHIFSAKKSSAKNETIDETFNRKKREKQKELDTLLDKIHRKGIDSLSQKEKERLKELS